MTTRHAACSCGQLHLECEGEPVRISMCHCMECQKRTGSVFGVQAFFPEDQVEVEGRAVSYVRVGEESGLPVEFRFCPTCGSTVYWEAEIRPGWVGVAVGCFTDPDFPPPRHSVWESCRHAWTEAPAKLPLERLS
jgi:hypothetical protein